MELTLHRGRPDSMAGRPGRETAVYGLLDRLGIVYEQVDHPAVETIDACAAIDEVLAPAVICKNLFLCNRQQTQFYLLMIRGDKKFHTKDISRQIGTARLSFAPAAHMLEYLNISPGAVSVLGLMNDTENHVQLLIDSDVLHEEYLGCHPCVNTASLRFPMPYLTEIFLPAVRHDYIEVTVPA